MAKRKKTGGREPGTPNRLTNELRTSLKNIVFNEFSELETRLNALETKDRIELLTKLLPYVLPKVQDICMDNIEPLDWGK